jgi:hypothetical protein
MVLALEKRENYFGTKRILIIKTVQKSARCVRTCTDGQTVLLGRELLHARMHGFAH